MRIFELLKDLPMTEVGTSYYLNGDHYYPHRKPNGTMFTLSEGKGYSVHKNWVENNPLWFKEIKDTEQSSKPFVWTDQLVADLVGVFCGMEDEEAMKEVEEYKRTKLSDLVTKEFLKEKLNYSIPAGKGTAIDVFNTEGKAWEIVAFKSSLGNICKLRANGKFCYDNQGTVGIWSPEVAQKDSTIHSVKRLSDGEVFSVGDELEELGYNSNERHKIFKIEIFDGGISLIYNEIGSGIMLKYAKKSQPPQQSKRIEVWGPHLNKVEDGECIWSIMIDEKVEISPTQKDKIKSAIEKILNNE